ncbi:MAG: PH domain-containing protein [Gulosibacter sp.]|uniref:PH domain-containing protein n=1 Tax=Gulosibacter sp. TaxID=2817531 RepID=UPI003F92209E
MTHQNPPQGWQPGNGQQHPDQNHPQFRPGQPQPQPSDPNQWRNPQGQYPQGQPNPGQPPHGQTPHGQPPQGQPPRNQSYPGQQPQGFPPQGPPPGQQPHPGQQPQGQVPPAGVPTTNLADGEWHRLHKSTPWIGAIGGIIASFFAIFWVVFGLLGSIIDGGANISPIIFILVALFGLVIVVLVALGAFLGYRNRQFRLTSEVFELRYGVLAKHNRQARLDRLQSVNLNRPVFARAMGLTQLETSGAGKDADIKLAYLGRDDAERLRAEILRRASGAKKRQKDQHRGYAPQPGAHPAPGQAAAGGPETVGAGAGAPVGAAPAKPRPRSLGDYLDAAVDDFASPELPAGTAPEPAVVRVSAGRIAGAGFLSVVLVALIISGFLALAMIPVSIIIGAATSENVLFIFLLGLLAIVGFMVFMAFVGGLTSVGTLVSSMNYTIAGTQDGVRIGRGALSQTNDTVPPGRIHSVQVRQPWIWRPFKWYEVKVDRADITSVASSDSNEQAASLQRQTVLPVGTWDEVQRVLALVLPMHMGPRTAEILSTSMSKGAQDTFVPAPSRAWWLHPIQWRGLGYAIDRGLVYLRRGRFSKRVAMVPGERIQSVTIHDSPIERGLGVVSLWINTVGQAVTTKLPSVDASRSIALFDELEALAVSQAAADTSHRWDEAQARTALATAHMAAQDAAKRGERLDPYTQRMLDAEAAWKRDQQNGSGGAVGQQQMQQRPPQQQAPWQPGPGQHWPGHQGPGSQQPGPQGHWQQGQGQQGQGVQAPRPHGQQQPPAQPQQPLSQQPPAAPQPDANEEQGRNGMPPLPPLPPRGPQQ